MGSKKTFWFYCFFVFFLQTSVLRVNEMLYLHLLVDCGSTQGMSTLITSPHVGVCVSEDAGECSHVGNEPWTTCPLVTSVSKKPAGKETLPIWLLRDRRMLFEPAAYIWFPLSQRQEAETHEETLSFVCILSVMKLQSRLWTPRVTNSGPASGSSCVNRCDDCVWLIRTA